MKILLTTVAIALTSILSAQHYFQNEVTITSTGTSHELVGDMEFNASQDVYRSVHKTNNGMAVFTYDSYGSIIDAQRIYRTTGASQFWPITMIDNMIYTHILFGFYVGGLPRYGIVKYNNLANTIVWVSGITNSANNIECVPKDMHIDLNTGDLYVTGNMPDVAGGDDDIFAARVSSSGALLWHVEYPMASWCEDATNIFYYSDSEIYIGASSYEISNGLNTRAHFIQIDNSGVVQQHLQLNYTTENSCNYFRIISACIKRQGNDLYATMATISGPNGSGRSSLYQLDPSFNIVNYVFFYPPNLYYDDKFEFTDNGNLIGIPGDIRIGSNTYGFAYSNFTTAGLFHTGTYNYPYTNNNIAIFSTNTITNAWNSNANEIMFVMDNYSNALIFHNIKGDYKGNTETQCSKTVDFNLYDCQLETSNPTLLGQAWLVSFPSPVFAMASLAHQVEITCDNKCPDCQQDARASAPINKSSIYPNPVDDEVTISNMDGITHVFIYDVQGKEMLNLTVEEDQNMINHNVSNLKPGVYFVRLIDSNGEESVHKLIKE